MKKMWNRIKCWLGWHDWDECQGVIHFFDICKVCGKIKER